MIRLCNSNDLNALCELDQLLFKPAWSAENWNSEIANATLCVIEIDQKVVAFALGSVCIDEYELLKIGVHPDHQSKGLGKMILEDQMVKVQALGVKRCFLEVRISNESAKALYLKQGWREIGLRKGYYSDGEDALIMEKCI